MGQIRDLYTVFVVTCAMALGACGQSHAPSESEDAEITPQQFVLLPCGDAGEHHPCALAIAGGKRILFGALGNAVSGLQSDDLRQLDAVFLFSLRSNDIEGLDDIRNRSWDAGRDTPLLVIGPTGTADFVSAINKAYEQADALRIVEDGIPPGGYDAAILVAREGRPAQTVFDTGDLVVRTVSGGYVIAYLDQSFVALLGCGAPNPSEVDIVVSCDPAEADANWPLEQRIRVSNGTP